VFTYPLAFVLAKGTLVAIAMWATSSTAQTPNERVWEAFDAMQDTCQVVQVNADGSLVTSCCLTPMELQQQAACAKLQSYVGPFMTAVDPDGVIVNSDKPLVLGSPPVVAEEQDNACPQATAEEDAKVCR